MPTFLYRFGYEFPEQMRQNDLHGWDDEDSQGVLIDAENEDAALAWGQEISERFVKLLFADDRISWRQYNFANWVEPPELTWPGQQRVAVGEYPDFKPWLPLTGGEA
jgi:hypothetical protein